MWQKEKLYSQIGGSPKSYLPVYIEYIEDWMSKLAIIF